MSASQIARQLQNAESYHDSKFHNRYTDAVTCAACSCGATVTMSGWPTVADNVVEDLWKGSAKCATHARVVACPAD